MNSCARAGRARAKVWGVLLILGLVCTAGPTASATISSHEKAEIRSPSPMSSVSSEPSIDSTSEILTSVDFAKIRTGLERLRDKSSLDDPRYFEDGRWEHGGADCVRCSVGPGVAAAAIWRLTGSEQWRLVALETMDTAIRENQQGDGSFAQADGGGGSVDIETALFALNLGLTTHLLIEGDGLDEGRRQQYSAAVSGAADFLERNGNYRWYTNGNIVLANAAVAGMAWRLTGDERYEGLYDEACEFATSPEQDRWPGRGLRYTVEPTEADGSDGAAYFTEKGAAGIGYDPDYTQMQADIASIMTLVIDDARSLRLTNLLLNQTLGDTDVETWLLDTSGGTRLWQPDRRVPLTTGALPVLASRGREDLVSLSEDQRSYTAEVMKGSAEYTDIGMYMNWAIRAAPMLMTLAPQDHLETSDWAVVASRLEAYPL